ncbi:hypothetical protein YC2023_060930 [Brassica napus]
MGFTKQHTREIALNAQRLITKRLIEIRVFLPLKARRLWVAKGNRTQGGSSSWNPFTTRPRPLGFPHMYHVINSVKLGATRVHSLYALHFINITSESCGLFHVWALCSAH